VATPPRGDFFKLEAFVSKDALAGVYATLLTNDEFRNQVSQDPSLLDTWDLTDEEKSVLAEEASQEVSAFSFESGGVMGMLSSGPKLSPAVASSLGTALNVASGLPTTALRGPGFASGAGCCPWQHPVASRGV